MPLTVCIVLSGMSTAPEVIVARQCGLLCFSLALVTNACVMVDDDTSKEEETAPVVNLPDAAGGLDSHEEVLNTGLLHAKNIELFFRGLIAEIAAMLWEKMQ